MLAIRPEHLRLASLPLAPNGGLQVAAAGAGPQSNAGLGEATVTETVFQGSFKRVLAVSRIDPSVRFVAKVAASDALVAGDTVAVSCRSDDVIVLTR